MKERPSGFTMTEVMIALAIIAVLAGLAIPGYFRTIETSRGNEALTTLNIIHMGEKIYRLNNGTFWAGGLNATTASIDSNLNVDISPQFYDDIDFSAVTANGYTCRVTRNSSSGGSTSWWQEYVWDDVSKTLTYTHNP